MFARLERKHGGSIAEVLAHAERCRARREELEQAEVALGEVEAELAAARAELDGLAGELSERRRRGGARSWPRRCASGWPSWRCPTRRSRSSCGRARTGAGRAGRMRSSC